MAPPARFVEVLRRQCRFVEPDAPIDMDASLESLGVDSLGMVSLVVDLEDEFQMAIPDELMTDEVFATPTALWTALEGYVGVDGTTGPIGGPIGGSIGEGVRNDGFVTLPEWLPARWSAALCDGLDRMAANHPSTKRLMPHQPFLDLLCTPLLDELVEPVLGPDFLFHHANGKRLTAGEGNVWHHDYDASRPWDGESATMMIHVMLYPAGLSADNGPLVVRPKTHLAAAPRHHPNHHGYEVEPGDVTVTGGPGTVVVLNSALWHMRPPARPEPRYYLNYSFIGPGAVPRPERAEYAELLAELPSRVDGSARTRLARLCRPHRDGEAS